MSFFDRFRGLAKKAELRSDAVAPGLSNVTPAQIAVERRNRKRKNARQGATALIIDDSPTVVAALRKILRSAGYITRDAGDAEHGLALMAELKPDLIFLDIVLPGMNGFGALRAIRKDPNTRQIPVIMISGNEHATEQFYANKIGADDFMKKPFSRFEVFAHIEMLLDANRELRRKDTAAAPMQPAAADVNEDLIKTMPRPRAAVTLGTPEMPPRKPPLPPLPQHLSSTLEARKELTAMGLQYFDQAQFLAAVRRGDHLAVALFVAGGGIAVESAITGNAAGLAAHELGDPEMIRLLTPAAGP